jgi:predicted dehydrogenase
MPSVDRTPDTADRPLRWGILGTGWIARLFVADLQLTGLQVAAVGSRTAEVAARFAADFGIAAAHPTYEALVADEGVDIVYVATPHPRHHADARLALAAGKHVLVEKPFTINAAEARDLAEFAAARNLLVLEAMWTRWLPHMLRLRELVRDGAIGDVRSVLADHTQRLPDDPAHRINALELGGGALLDLGVYPISFASQLLGTPESIEATATFKETGADAETGIVLRCPHGRTAALYTASTTAGPNVAAVIGREGWIEVDAVWYTPTSFHLYDPSGALVESFDGRGPGRGMQFQAQEAERLVRAGRITSEVMPISETITIMETLDRVRKQIGLRYPSE